MLMVGLKYLLDPTNGLFVYPYSVLAVFMWAFVLSVALISLLEKFEK